jgi:hypothetical protein
VPDLGEPPSRMDPRMIFSSDLATLYVATPKTGCTTIKTVVAAAIGLLDPSQLSGRARGRIHRAWRVRDRTWSDLTDEEREKTMFSDAAYRFTSVRNPYERLVSCYLDKIADGESYHLGRRLHGQGEVTMLSFLQFVADQPPLRRDVHCRAMVDLCHFDKIRYDDIIRYEYFERDIRRVMGKLNLFDFPLPTASLSQRTDAGHYVHELLGEAECSLIQAIYHRDFDAFGYSRDLFDVGKRW